MEFITTKDVANALNISPQAVLKKIEKNDILTFKVKNNQKNKYYIPKDYYNIKDSEKKECKIIAVNNLKGGVGKTTVATNISALLSKLDKKVLLIDLDPQSNATTTFLNPREIEISLKEIIDMYTNKKDVTKDDVKEAIVNLDIDDYSFDLLPSRISLAKAIDILRTVSHTAVLKIDTMISQIKDEYDYIIIDTPPNASIIMQMALYATDAIIAVTILEQYSVDSMMELFDEIEEVQTEIKQYKGKRVDILSIVANNAQNLNIHKALYDIVKELATAHDIPKVYQIPKDTKVAEAQLEQTPLCSYKDELNSGAKALEPLLQIAIDITKEV